jgi:hypothetical protein
MLLQLLVDHLANRANFSDPYGMFGKNVVICAQMVRHKYCCITKSIRLEPRRRAMKANCPNVRLNIKGEVTVH